MEALVQVFRDELSEVEFPDINLASLEADRARVVDAHQELERARKVLEVALEDLRVRSTKAHAYALVFANADTALLERLNQIPLKRRGKSSAKKTTKSRKAKKEKAPLFEQEPPEDALEAAE